MTGTAGGTRHRALLGMPAPPAAPRIFLLSPARAGGKRADLLLSGRGRFPLAERLRAGSSVTLGDAFSFLSGLYFRGKLAYADRFARPPEGVSGVHIITSNRGLLPADTVVNADELRSFAEVEIRPDEPRYREPLQRDLAAIARSTAGESVAPELVLLGSVATGKYVDVLLDVVGERLLFPTDFVGRGDMSRGALLLRTARADQELAYEPVATAIRRGSRPGKAGPSDGDDEAGAHAPLPAPSHRR
jgi:hypothetical protein